VNDRSRSDAVRVAIVDDHPLLCEALGSLLEATDDMEYCGAASDLEAGYRLVDAQRPDVLVVDLIFPGGNGLELVERVLARDPSPRVLVLTGRMSTESALSCYQAGAHGFLPKTSRRDEIVGAIRRVATGRRFVHADYASEIVDFFSSGGRSRPSGWHSLTQRERAVVRELSSGATTAEIAGRLNISPRTVDSHRRNVLRKVGARNNVELLRLMLEMGLE